MVRRTLRADILTLFLALFTFSFLCVMLLTYFFQSKAIESVSAETMESASKIVIERIEGLVHDTLHFPTITDAIVLDKEDISVENPHLIAYLFKIIEFGRDFSNIAIGSTDGTFIKVSNLHLSTQHNWMTKPTQPLPADACYSLFLSQNTGKEHKNTWIYLNEQFQKIGFEESRSDQYDPRTREWYQGALRNQGVYWSDVITYYVTGDKGISVSEPLYDREDKVVGVCGVELSFVLLSRFLSEQKVGQTGRVSLVNEAGTELVFTGKTTPNITAAYKQYRVKEKKTFSFANAGVKYLAFVDRLSLVQGKQWLIVIVVPEIDFFARLMQTEKAIALTTLAILLLSSFCVFLFSTRLSSPIVRLAKEVDKMQHLDLSGDCRVHSHIKEIRLIDTAIAAMRTALNSFIRYVPQRIVQRLFDRGEEITLGGDKKEITIFFSDITGFAPYSEEHSTEEVMTFLFDYFDALSKRIVQEKGIIDKYIGDSIMAFWGAPDEMVDHAQRGCTAALRCQAFLNVFNRERQEKREAVLFTRMALNSGNVLVGNIGTQQRMNYTVMGDVINLAAHLQQVSKLYRVPILLTEETNKRVEGKFLTRYLDTCEVPGKKAKVKIYELIALLQGEKELLPTDDKRELCTLFARAVEAFEAEDNLRAFALFSQLHEKFPDDTPTRLYLEKLRSLKQS